MGKRQRSAGQCEETAPSAVPRSQPAQTSVLPSSSPPRLARARSKETVPTAAGPPSAPALTVGMAAAPSAPPSWMKFTGDKRIAAEFKHMQGLIEAGGTQASLKARILSLILQTIPQASQHSSGLKTAQRSLFACVLPAT